MTVLPFIPFSILIVGLTWWIAHYFVLTPFLGQAKYYYWMTAILYGIFSLYGYLIALWSSFDQCGKVNHGNSLRLAQYMSITVIIMWIASSYFSFLRQPFIELWPTYGFDVAYVYFLSIAVLLPLILIYFTSAKENCRLSAKEIETNLVELDQKLNEPYEETEKPKIQVKD